jgi:hypothetical protein
MIEIFHISPLPAHVFNLWNEAKALLVEEESCKRFPKLAEAVFEFEEHLAFKGQVEDSPEDADIESMMAEFEQLLDGKPFTEGGDAS